MERVLPGKRGGWFVDAGAGPDGIRGSNTYVLEKELGWTGLLIEPHPDCYARVKSNRSAIVEQCCLADSFGEVEFVLHEYPELSSVPEHLSEPNFVAAGYASGRKPRVQMPSAPLWELLRRHHAPRVIDYMSLDIEGAEWFALKDFPIDEFRILCTTIERGGRMYEKLRRRLLAEGYRLVRVTDPDDFYVHASVEYETTLAEQMDTEVRRLWNSVYFREPMLTVRRTARWVRRAQRGY
jgi:FkbM family methyltransferase